MIQLELFPHRHEFIFVTEPHFLKLKPIIFTASRSTTPTQGRYYPTHLIDDARHYFATILCLNDERKAS